MCGLAGFVGSNHKNSYKTELIKMADAIKHRGPDSEGFWIDHNNNIALCHRRLSIIELSKSGNQPMISNSGRLVMVFNGEIYNHLELRRELESQSSFNVNWAGGSDTESLIECISHYGLEKALKKAEGMFSLVLFDRGTNELCLARDRIGEKPLYYGFHNEIFFFSSELKALKAHSQFKGEINSKAVSLQLKLGYIPFPHSIYEGIHKLRPGSFLKFKVVNGKVNKESNSNYSTYWSLSQIISEGKNNIFQNQDKDAIEHLDSLLSLSVKKQMISDVPVGAFLSGGTDSSTIACLMQKHSLNPIKTFTIGFHENQYNEAETAKEIAENLGFDHTELYMHSRDALSIIPKLSLLYDEPFSDSSQIPTFLISELTKSQVKVSLSGDGGDELFGGYNRYNHTLKYWAFLSKLPLSVRKMISKIIINISPENWNNLFKIIYSFVSKKKQIKNIGDKIHKAADLLTSYDINELYDNMISDWKNPQNLWANKDNVDHINLSSMDYLKLNQIESMMALDTLTYLPDDILVKVDRAAMGVSLETRVPFLDKDVIQFSWQLPFEMKIREGKSKWILKQILNKYLPMDIIDRPKMGFGVPIEDWLRGPLKEWACDLLNERRVKTDGFINYESIKLKLDEHLSGKRNWQYQIWNVLMFQSWLVNEK